MSYKNNLFVALFVFASAMVLSGCKWPKCLKKKSSLACTGQQSKINELNNSDEFIVEK
jgi:hypothetical protein